MFLVPFKKGHWPNIMRIVEETKLPTVVLGPLGVLLAVQVRELHKKPGVYMINSLDNFEAVEQGMRMVRTASWMRQSRILNIARTAAEDRIGAAPRHEGAHRGSTPSFIEEFKRTGATDEVKELAATIQEQCQAGLAAQ